MHSLMIKSIEGRLMRFTVFTPTFNRGYIIENLYHSLRSQTYVDFEWIVIDDGSTDNTKDLFRVWCEEDNSFPIRYIQVENGGKHRAINIGVQLANGELFFIVDSDDALPSDSLEIVDRVENSIPSDMKKYFCGVCGCKGYFNKQPVGKSFADAEKDYIDITALERPKYGIKGDKAEVFYTKSLINYPFPEYENENFVTECVVWDKMAYDGLKLRFFNDIIYLCDYLPDGLTHQGKDLFRKNPLGWGRYIYQSVLYGKVYGLTKWEMFWDYYNTNKKRMSLKKIANNLHINPIALWLRMNGMRLFYKIYRE